MLKRLLNFRSGLILTNSKIRKVKIYTLKFYDNNILIDSENFEEEIEELEDYINLLFIEGLESEIIIFKDNKKINSYKKG